MKFLHQRVVETCLFGHRHAAQTFVYKFCCSAVNKHQSLSQKGASLEGKTCQINH